MSVTVEKAKIEDMSLKFDENGVPKSTGTYALMSSKGKVLARQPFNQGYGSEIKVVASPATQHALEKFLDLFQNDLNLLLGLTETP